MITPGDCGATLSAVYRAPTAGGCQWELCAHINGLGKRAFRYGPTTAADVTAAWRVLFDHLQVRAKGLRSVADNRDGRRHTPAQPVDTRHVSGSTRTCLRSQFAKSKTEAVQISTLG